MNHLIINHEFKIITFAEYPALKFWDFVIEKLEGHDIYRNKFYYFLTNLLQYFKKGYVFIYDEHWEGHCFNVEIKDHVDCNFGFYELLDEFKKKNNLRDDFFKIISGNLYYFFYENCNYIHPHLSWILSYAPNWEQNPKKEKVDNIDYRFCYLNRVVKDWRIPLYDKMIQHPNILKKSIWSWNAVGLMDYPNKKYYHISKSLEENSIKSDDDYALIFGTEDAIQNSYVQIVVESEINKESLFLSEKILKAIWEKKPFLVLGSERYLEVLRKLGFKTFDDFWYEGYDYESNFTKRVDKLFESIVYINNISDDEFKSMMKSDDMKDILEHNYINLQRLRRKVETNIQIPQWQTKSLFDKPHNFHYIEQVLDDFNDIESYIKYDNFELVKIKETSTLL